MDELKTTAIDLGSGVKLEMIAIPGGSFLMGSEDFKDTEPVHKVTLSPFYIGKFQITQAQWQAVMDSNPSRFKGNTLPVESISWHDAVSFCEKLSKQIGKHFRLPTEAEWEYACLAGSTGKYCFGDDEALLKDYAWYNQNSGDKTHPVGEKKPNNWGLCDMHGNVWEWCSDWYGKNYYAELARQGEAVNPQGPATGDYRVLRGGSWFNNHLYARAVYRGYDHAADRDSRFGFRVVAARPPSDLNSDGALAPRVITETGNDGGSRWVWLKNADGRHLAGITQYADAVTLTMGDPTIGWSDHWRQGSTGQMQRARLADAEEMAEALRQAIEIAREWAADAGRPHKEVLR